MNEALSSTHQYLLQRYGPMLTLKHLAEVMHSTPNGLRMALSRRQHPFVTALAGARRKLGRRVYFDARQVAAVIDRENAEGSPVACPVTKEPDVQQGSLPLREAL